MHASSNCPGWRWKRTIYWSSVARKNKSSRSTLRITRTNTSQVLRSNVDSPLKGQIYRKNPGLRTIHRWYRGNLHRSFQTISMLGKGSLKLNFPLQREGFKPLDKVAKIRENRSPFLRAFYFFCPGFLEATRCWGIHQYRVSWFYRFLWQCKYLMNWHPRSGRYSRLMNQTLLIEKQQFLEWGFWSKISHRSPPTVTLIDSNGTFGKKLECSTVVFQLMQ